MSNRPKRLDQLYQQEVAIKKVNGEIPQSFEHFVFNLGKDSALPPLDKEEHIPKVKIIPLNLKKSYYNMSKNELESFALMCINAGLEMGEGTRLYQTPESLVEKILKKLKG